MPQFEFPFIGERERLNGEVRAGLPGQFIELPDGVVHYELGGPEDGAPVVLVHGFSVPYFIWDPTFEVLTDAGFRVLRYDLYGRGYSDRPRARYDEALFERQLLGLLDALEFREPVHLVGLSMGGVIAIHFVNRHPERVSRLVLVDPAGFDLGFPLWLRLVTMPGVGEVLFSLTGNLSLLKSMADDFYDPKHVAQFIGQYLPQMKYKGFKRAILSTIRSGMLGDALDAYRQVGRSERPVLLIWGREDRTVPFENSAKVVEAIPQVEFHAIEETGHIPHYERPEVVNPILIEFLRK